MSGCVIGRFFQSSLCLFLAVYVDVSWSEKEQHQKSWVARCANRIGRGSCLPPSSTFPFFSLFILFLTSGFSP